MQEFGEVEPELVSEGRPGEGGVDAEGAEAGEEEGGAVEGEVLAVVDEEGAVGGDAVDERHFCACEMGGVPDWYVYCGSLFTGGGGGSREVGFQYGFSTSFFRWEWEFYSIRGKRQDLLNSEKEKRR